MDVINKSTNSADSTMDVTSLKSNIHNDIKYKDPIIEGYKGDTQLKTILKRVIVDITHDCDYAQLLRSRMIALIEHD